MRTQVFQCCAISFVVVLQMLLDGQLNGTHGYIERLANVGSESVLRAIRMQYLDNNDIDGKQNFIQMHCCLIEFRLKSSYGTYSV